MSPFVVPPAMSQVEVRSAAGAAALLRARPRRAVRLALALREAVAALAGVADGGEATDGVEVGGVPGDEAVEDNLPSAVPPAMGIP